MLNSNIMHMVSSDDKSQVTLQTLFAFLTPFNCPGGGGSGLTFLAYIIIYCTF